MSGKIKARNITSQVVGPTFDHNDPAKFSNKGKWTGKIMSGKTVVSPAKGPTFTEGQDSPIKDMHPSAHGVGKSMGQKSDDKFNPYKSKVNLVEQRTASAKSGETTPSYPLKKSYEK